jgi:aryl-phospho-beta-D-glucosidase BglC (GH1 family)
MLLLVASVVFIPELSAQQTKPWYQDGPWRFPKPNPKAKILPLIKVVGNKFVNTKGDTILFRGLSISDPDKIERQGHWNKAHFEKVKEMGAMLVRIPVHPVAWRERTPEKYLELLDQAVEWCTDLGMYIIIDWHSLGNLGMELFIAGLDWAYDLSPLHDDPINAEGIGYVTHPYANKRSQPWEPKWEENFGFAADKYPVVATEFGFGGFPGQNNDNDYGNRIIKYLEGRDISWLCWVFDPEWGPRLLQSWQYDLTDGGKFFKKALLGELDFQKAK